MQTGKGNAQITQESQNRQFQPALPAFPVRHVPLEELMETTPMAQVLRRQSPWMNDALDAWADAPTGVQRGCSLPPVACQSPERAGSTASQSPQNATCMGVCTLLWRTSCLNPDAVYASLRLFYDPTSTPTRQALRLHLACYLSGL